MARLHLFNPQSDLQLANGSPNFTAPKAATDFAVAAAVLPMWYGSAGDVFAGAVNRRWLETMMKTFGINIVPFHGDANDYTATPWGWSPAVRRAFLAMGYAPECLPDADQVERWRQLSSRVTSARAIAEIMHAVPDIVANAPARYAPRIATTASAAMIAIADLGRAMLKLPWSNAGRGQQDTDRTTPDELVRRVSGMISRQGAIEIAPYYTKRLDFAMLFEPGRFVGYSLFDTDTHGGWTGNILVDDDEIERRIVAVAERDIDFETLRRVARDVVTHYAVENNYTGPVGIDFMVAAGPDDVIVVPPVEINWRRTMGHVSHTFYARYIAPGTVGVLSTPLAADVPAVPFDASVIDGERIVEGDIDLVPSGGLFRVRVHAERL